MEYLINKAESLADKKKYKEAFELLEQADEKNNPVASYALGTWYLHGTYVEKDLEKAIPYLVKASHGEVKEAFYDLAVCYEKGVGIKKNLQKAFENYLIAAHLGDKDSLYEIVRCLYYGIGIQKNRNLSELLYNKVFKLAKATTKTEELTKTRKAVLA
jgi:TPR repeat protein